MPHKKCGRIRKNTCRRTRSFYVPIGLFQPLDDFLRTSNVGEFFARLQMVRAFAAQLGSASSEASSATAGSPLGTVLQGLWQFYSEVFKIINVVLSPMCGTWILQHDLVFIILLVSCASGVLSTPAESSFSEYLWPLPKLTNYAKPFNVSTLLHSSCAMLKLSR